MHRSVSHRAHARTATAKHMSFVGFGNDGRDVEKPSYSSDNDGDNSDTDDNDDDDDEPTN